MHPARNFDFEGKVNAFPSCKTSVQVSAVPKLTVSLKTTP